MAPIDMVLHCPACGLQHIDARDCVFDHFDPPGSETPPDEYAERIREMQEWERTHTWNNPPHRSHLCRGCGHVWRPADVPTNGVAAVQTRGNADSPIHDCLAGHKHSWRNVEGLYAPIRSECRHCGVVLPF